MLLRATADLLEAVGKNNIRVISFLTQNWNESHLLSPLISFSLS